MHRPSRAWCPKFCAQPTQRQGCKNAVKDVEETVRGYGLYPRKPINGIAGAANAANAASEAKDVRVNARRGTGQPFASSRNHERSGDSSAHVPARPSRAMRVGVICGTSRFFVHDSAACCRKGNKPIDWRSRVNNKNSMPKIAFISLDQQRVSLANLEVSKYECFVTSIIMRVAASAAEIAASVSARPRH